jgi:hypothetical protein
MHGMDMMEHRGPRGIRIWLRSIGVFQIAPDYNLVEVYPDRETDQQALGFGLAGPILLFVRHVRGSPGLHASALVIGEDAIAFLGPQRSGKSTLAAALLRVGATLLTDDALPLAVRDDGICGYPGLPFMKLWRETAHHTLNLGDDLPRLVPGVDKRLLELEGRFPVAPEPATLRALYVLNRYDPVRTGRSDIALEPLTQKEALLALLAHTFGRAYLLPGDDRQALPLFARLLAQSPVSLLSYPSGFDQQAAVSARILDDLVRR